MLKDFEKFFEVLKKIRFILDREDKKKAAVIYFDIIICAIVETVGVGLIVPFISVLATPEKMFGNRFIKGITKVCNINEIQLIIAISVSLILFYVIKNIFLMISSYWQNRFRYSLQKKLSVKMLRSYMSRPYLFFVNTNSSVIIRGIGNDVGCVKDALGTIFDLSTQILTLVMIAVFLAYTDFLMAVGLLGVSVICMYVLVAVLRKKTSSLGREERIADEKVIKYSHEMLDGIKEILALRKQDKFITTYEKAFSRKGEIETKYMTFLTFPNRVIETIFMSGIVIILLIRLIQGVELTTIVPQLAAFAVGGIKMLPAMSTVSRSVTQIIFQKPGVDEAYENLKNISLEEFSDRSDEKIDKFEKMTIEDIYWRYSDAARDVIDGLSLEIKEGESVAFIGASGSGKTTLVDILLGLLQPQKGTIKVNDVNLYDCIDSWSNLFSYVQQNIFLTDDTLRNNIAFGVDEENIDDDKIWRALEQAQLADFVRGLDKGLDTIVGERGVKFSGGQRQRVAIARALYYGTQVIIFDEATAALDNETEKSLMESIDALHGNKTLIIVAHRLSTVKNCDKIYEVKSGKVIERRKEELGI